MPSPTPGLVVAGAPAIDVFEDVIYRPLLSAAIDQDESWGIYDNRGRLVDLAAYSWGPGRHLLGQSERQEVGSEVFVDQTMVYGGVYIDHFGHFLLSTLSRLWPFADPAMCERYQGLPLLMHGGRALEMAGQAACGRNFPRVASRARPAHRLHAAGPHPALDRARRELGRDGPCVPCIPADDACGRPLPCRRVRPGAGRTGLSLPGGACFPRRRASRTRRSSRRC